MCNPCKPNVLMAVRLSQRQRLKCLASNKCMTMIDYLDYLMDIDNCGVQETDEPGGVLEQILEILKSYQRN